MSSRLGVSANRRTDEPKGGDLDRGQDGITVDMRVFAPASASRAEVAIQVLSAYGELLAKIEQQWPLTPE